MLSRSRSLICPFRVVRRYQLSRLHCVFSRRFTSDLFSPTEEHTSLRNSLRKWVKSDVEDQALLFNKEEKFNQSLFKKCAELGLLGITAEEKYGGSELDAVAAVIANEEISYSDPGFCLSYLAHSTLFVNNLSQNGSSAQKEKYLPSACSGDTIGGMCMSESETGTDALAMTMTAVREDESKGGNWILNGGKMWITNGCVSDDQPGDVFLVYARTGAKDQQRDAISQFIVESSFKGFSLGFKIKDKCGMRSSPTAGLVFDECIVPAENLVGEIGKAHRCMMQNLEIERLVLAAMSLGIARRCIDEMNQYATDRLSFGRPLRDHGQIQRHLSESYAEYMAARTYVYHAALHTDLNEPGHRLDTDGSKLVAGPMAKRVADRAMQVLGGNGYVGEFVVERLWRDSKLLEIGGGTNEALQMNITKELKSIEKLE